MSVLLRSPSERKSGAHGKRFAGSTEGCTRLSYGCVGAGERLPKESGRSRASVRRLREAIHLPMECSRTEIGGGPPSRPRGCGTSWNEPCSTLMEVTSAIRDEGWQVLATGGDKLVSDSES